MLPFTHAEFVGVFVQYNRDAWPAQVVAYLVGAAMVLALLRPSAGTGRFVAAGLAAMWLWTGIAYHGFHFSIINKMAWLFGALFVVEGLMLLRSGFMGSLRFGARTQGAWLGWALIFYSCVLYPLFGLWAGNAYSELPMFGITPCPVTLFTLGVLLLATAPLPRGLLLIPVIWSLVGGSAAFLLEVPQDWLLLFSGLATVALLRGSAQAILRVKA